MRRKDIVILIERTLFEDKKKKCHITLNNRRFHNGTVVDYSGKDTFSFVDDKLGYINILFSQVINVEPYKDEKNN